MFTGLSTVATRSTPPRFGAPWAKAASGPRPARPAPAAAAAARASQARRVRPGPVGSTAETSGRSWSLMVLSLVGAVVHDAILHDQPDALQRGHVLQGIAVQRDQIGAPAGLERADFVVDATGLGAPARAGQQ